jgi:hypothetical protein
MARRPARRDGPAAMGPPRWARRDGPAAMGPPRWPRRDGPVRRDLRLARQIRRASPAKSGAAARPDAPRAATLRRSCPQSLRLGAE